jgi:hypothetical protein
MYERSPDIWSLRGHPRREWEQSVERRPIRALDPGMRAQSCAEGA